MSPYFVLLCYSTDSMSRMYISNSIMDIIFITGVLLSTVGAKGVAATAAKITEGFSMSRFPVLHLFSLQCNGSHLPNDVRGIQAMNLKRQIANSKPVTIASISHSDGVRLENRLVGTNIYVNGVFDVDNIQGTYLTVLMNDIMPADESDVTYICLIVYSNKDGDFITVRKILNTKATDIQSMHQVTEPETEAPMETDGMHTGQVSPSKESYNKNKGFNPPMILLIGMAGLLLILFIVCITLVVFRCKEKRRLQVRAKRLSKRQSTCSKEFHTTMDPDCRPLPAPPTWSYPPGNGVPQYRDSNHRKKFGSGVKSYTDDTGYISDASMLYDRPFEDGDEAIAEKNSTRDIC